VIKLEDWHCFNVDYLGFLLEWFDKVQCMWSWSHKLVREWTKRDYAAFSVYSWVLVFAVLTAARLIQTRTLDLVFTAAFSVAMIPVELLIVIAFQKYSANTKALEAYPALAPSDFNENRLLKEEKSLVFFYSKWCPYCRKSFRLLKIIPGSQLKLYTVDLSEESNPLWTYLNIETVPTLIAFKSGTEFWRANGIPMVGLRKEDFKQAATLTTD
jgi:thiol-disulfide isomerase/thioredoxin